MMGVRYQNRFGVIEEDGAIANEIGVVPKDEYTGIYLVQLSLRNIGLQFNGVRRYGSSLTAVLDAWWD